jgi:hypothetical protein
MNRNPEQQRLDLRGLIESAHHELVPAPTEGLLSCADKPGYSLEISAPDAGNGLERFQLFEFKDVPGVFVTKDTDLMHVSGSLPDVVRDLCDAQVLREAGEIDQGRSIFIDLKEASLQRDEQFRHIQSVTDYLREIEIEETQPAQNRQQQRGMDLSR